MIDVPNPTDIPVSRDDTRGQNSDPSSKRVIGKPFQPGQSGNPNGRPKDEFRVAELARSYTAEAIETLARLMREGAERTQVMAANALLDRGWGRPKESIKIDAGDEQRARQQVEVMAGLRKDPKTAAALLILAEASAKMHGGISRDDAG